MVIHTQFLMKILIGQSNNKWDTIKQELIQGNIPFQDEIFDKNSLGFMQTVIY